MKDDHGLPPEEDAALHAWLDGELTEEQAAALASRLDREPLLRRRLEFLRRIGQWAEESRPNAPPHLAERILQAAGMAPRSGLRPSRGPQPSPPAGLSTRLAGLLKAWGRPLVWVPSAAVAVVALGFALHAVITRPGRGLEAPRAAAEEGTGAVPCTFRLPAAGAHQVCLVGTFNLWRICETPLKPSADGTWSVTVDLPPGRYEYMFVVDGKWRTDPSAHLHVDDGFGQENAVLLL